MVTVAKFSALNQAYLLRSVLEANEIPSFIPDEYSAQNNMIGGDIRLQVSEEFVEQAKPLVEQFQRESNESARLEDG